MSLRAAAVGAGRAARAVDAQAPAVGQIHGVEEAHVRAVPRQRTGHAQLRACLQHVGPDAVARELRDAVRLAHVLARAAVLVQRRNVQVAVRIPRLVLGDGPLDADALAGVEMRREAVVGRSLRHAEQRKKKGGPGGHGGREYTAIRQEKNGKAIRRRRRG